MKRETKFSRILKLYNRRAWLPILICLLASAQQMFGQQTPPESIGATGKTQTTARQTRIKVAPSGEITLKAENVSTGTVAQQLSRKLDVPIVSSPLVRGKRLSLDINNLPLERAVQALAPHTRIDYVQSRTENDGAPRPVAVYLNGYNEPEPSTARGIGNNPLALVIEGETEEADVRKGNDTEMLKGGRLKISVAGERVTVIARRQSLSFVLSEIAARAGLEFDLRYESDRLIDVEIDDKPLTEALLSLSPDVRVYTRRDLLIERTTAFRVSLSKHD